jgi:hypothetical protein
LKGLENNDTNEIELQNNSTKQENHDGNILEHDNNVLNHDELKEDFTHFKPAGPDIDPPEPPIADLELMIKSIRDAKMKLKIPEAPVLKHGILLHVKQRLDMHREEQRKIPVPPALTMKGLMNAKIQLDSQNKQAAPSPPPLNSEQLEKQRQDDERLRLDDERQRQVDEKQRQDDERQRQDDERQDDERQDDERQRQDDEKQRQNDERQRQDDERQRLDNESQIDVQNQNVIANAENSSPIMDIDRIQQLKYKLLKAKFENKEELQSEPVPKRKSEVQYKINIREENFIEHKPLSSEGHVANQNDMNFRYSEDLPSVSRENFDSLSRSVTINEGIEEIKEESEDYQPLMPSKTYIVVNDAEIAEDEEGEEEDDEVEDRHKIIFSPKFENFDNDLNEREDKNEDLKFNKMLVSNINTLEKELKKAHKQINYLEEYNNQLVKSKNDLYEEKEDLIKRSIEFEYIQKRLDDKEKRLVELEYENARRNSEVKGLKNDNVNLRDQMKSMIEFIKKLSTSKMVSNNDQESSRELTESINIFSERIRNASIESVEMDNRSMNHTQPVGTNYEYITLSGTSPERKILKKKYKVTKSKKKQRKLASPLNKDQLKLLHDPASFEKYAKDLEVEIVKDLYSDVKPTRELDHLSKPRTKKAKSTSRGNTKNSRNIVSPL